MFTRLGNWLHNRTGYRDWLAPIQRRVLPGGPSWAYTTAAALLWLLIIEVVTGVLLMSSYSPSMSDAWASVHYIEQSPTGSFIRGLHYFTAQAMIVLFVAHTIRVLLTAAFRSPHEVIWITGLCLIPVMIVWAITGNPLSGTQTGSSQIEVEGNIIASTPWIGPVIQRILIGGDDVGNLTLTHLYTLHVAVFPFLAGLLLFIHISQVYKHGLSVAYREQKPQGSSRPYWPYQTARNMFVFGVIFGAIAWFAWRRGAPLEAPADPTLPHSPRPEWYFLFLFELRRYFVGPSEWIATILLPGASLLLLLAMPVIDRVFPRKLNSAVRVLVVLVGLGAFTGLTFAAVWRDRQDTHHQETLALSRELGERARELADRQGISVEGAIALLRGDPQTQGPLLFRQHCLACHPHAGPTGRALAAEKPSAPNLFGCGTEEWIAGFLDPETIVSEAYFGKSAQAEGEMVGAIRDAFSAAEDDAAKQELRQKMRLVARALAAEATPGQARDAKQTEEIETGIKLITEELGCVDCHRFRDAGDLGSAPDLTGYGSPDWLRGMISNPAHERFYPGDKNDRMPAFAQDPTAPGQNLLTERELDLLVRWLAPGTR